MQGTIILTLTEIERANRSLQLLFLNRSTGNVAPDLYFRTLILTEKYLSIFKTATSISIDFRI